MPDEEITIKLPAGTLAAVEDHCEFWRARGLRRRPETFLRMLVVDGLTRAINARSRLAHQEERLEAS